VAGSPLHTVLSGPDPPVPFRRAACPLVTCEPWTDDTASGPDAARLALLRLLFLQRQTRRAVRWRQREAAALLARSAAETCIVGLYSLHADDATKAFAAKDAAVLPRLFDILGAAGIVSKAAVEQIGSDARLPLYGDMAGRIPEGADRNAAAYIYDSFCSSTCHRCWRSGGCSRPGCTSSWTPSVPTCWPSRRTGRCASPDGRQFGGWLPVRRQELPSGCLTQARLPGILSRVPDAGMGFSSSAVSSTLREACAHAWLASSGAELLRLGENAIYQLAAAPVVVRIARSADRMRRVERELCVARWLAAAEVPAVRVYEAVQHQPLLIDGHPVTFWHSVTGGEPAPTQVDLARLLASFHALSGCPCDLPGFDPLRSIESRLAAADNVPRTDRDFLSARCADLHAQLEGLTFALPRGPIHGDAHPKNLLTDHGQVVLLDFESVATGPREWDLLPSAIAVDRYGLPEKEYREFAGAYGFDVRTWTGYPVLREVRELTMTTWIMQNVGESRAIADEFALRVACLRERDSKRAWNFF
jgi:aminoglycoside phosphotransferase (APT) family kinase protein